ncbi:MAG: hypothetical protein SNJ55_09935 [Chloroherpetonaceae bacterium]
MKSLVFALVAFLGFGHSLDASAQKNLRVQLNKARSFANQIDEEISKGRVLLEKILLSEQGDIFIDVSREITMWVTKRGVKIKVLETFGGSGYDIQEYYFNKKARLVIVIRESKQESRKCYLFNELDEPIICAVANWLQEEFEFSPYYDIHPITFEEREELEGLGRTLNDALAKLPQDEQSLKEFMRTK